MHLELTGWAILLLLVGTPFAAVSSARLGVVPALLASATVIAGVLGGSLRPSLVIDWDAVAALATLAAVITALLPIWIEATRRSHRARSLRLRIAGRLACLRPSLASFFLPTSHSSLQGVPVLSPSQFADVVRGLDDLLAEAEVLASEEQDQLSVTLLNLSVASVHLAAEQSVPASSAQNLIRLIDKCIGLFEVNGLTRDAVETPW